MSRLGFNKSVVYHGEAYLGELDVIPTGDNSFRFPNNEIRVHHFSQVSERCPPLSVLLTISSFSVRCKLESSFPVKQPLLDLHASCFYELKTAVVLIGDEEMHLVAMASKLKKFPCFWCCLVPAQLYNACLGMLNMRCLSIVFDLDETLIVANTMKSFEDRIELLTGWIGGESDPVRVSGMTSELKRYVDDLALLKQYAENDAVTDNGQMYNVKLEDVPVNAAGNEWVLRPVIRLAEKNIVLTRINPEIRDTSVLVRLRPAWEDLRSYLIAKGRKRFEVYVCTMAERDYALEMWRLLDPECHLITPKQLLNRIVCVKSGARKSLLHVFQDRNCHPRMAMVIDDRLKVWEEKDQPRVHVVPAFTPYYALQAETANAVPVLCVARNVVCNVRGGFFKEFDENLQRKLSEHFYEDEALDLPSAPDVCNYLMSEDASFVPNGNTNAPMAEGINGPEVAHKLSHMMSSAIVNTNHSNLSSFYLKGLFEKDKLTGLNYLDWLRNLRIVLRMEDKIRAIEEDLPEPPAARATQAVRDDYERRRSQSNEVACLMLATMAPELQKGMESLGAYDIMLQLKDMFQQQARQERFETVKSLMGCKMATGSSVSVHVLKMKGYTDQLERMGFPISQDLATDCILNSLTSSYDAFVLNYNMNNMEKTIMELHGMLKTVESNMAKAKPATAGVLTIREGGVKKKKTFTPKGKGKGKVGYANSGPKPKGVVFTSKIPQAKSTKEAICFHCGDEGHWRRSCPKYLKELKELKEQGVVFRDS